MTMVSIIFKYEIVYWQIRELFSDNTDRQKDRRLWNKRNHPRKSFNDSTDRQKDRRLWNKRNHSQKSFNDNSPITDSRRWFRISQNI